MAAYGICLVTVLITAIKFYWWTILIPPTPDDKWLNIFKDGFSFLGGLLATIVGYYFGNRNVGDALEKAKQGEVKAVEAKSVAQAVIEQLKDVTRQSDPVGTGIAPTASEEGLEGPVAPPTNS
jgi:prolipoprotein diacylglyceryltransferase